jgi:hypothetical protein
MSKLRSEDCRHLSVYKLHEWGCFKVTHKEGSISWQRGGNARKDHIEYMYNQSRSTFRVKYTVTDGYTREKMDVEHLYPILITECNYGGQRYWFECSVYNGGVYCGRRVAKLYLGGGSNYFACRHCYDLTYESRICGWAYTDVDIDEAAYAIKRWYYRGVPTRKHRALLKKQAAVDRMWVGFSQRIGKYAH